MHIRLWQNMTCNTEKYRKWPQTLKAESMNRDLKSLRTLHSDLLESLCGVCYFLWINKTVWRNELIDPTFEIIHIYQRKNKKQFLWMWVKAWDVCAWAWINMSHTPFLCIGSGWPLDKSLSIWVHTTGWMLKLLRHFQRSAVQWFPFIFLSIKLHCGYSNRAAGSWLT